MDSQIGFEISLIVAETIRGRCASFVILTATVSEIFVLVVYIYICNIQTKATAVHFFISGRTGKHIDNTRTVRKAGIFDANKKRADMA